MVAGWLLPVATCYKRPPSSSLLWKMRTLVSMQTGQIQLQIRLKLC